MSRFAKCSAGVALIVVAALGVLWFLIFPTPKFPEPTGPYAIGTRSYAAWTDTSRPEPFTAEPGDHRQVVVQIWYPTHANGPREHYVADDETMVPVAARFHVPVFLLRHIQYAPTHSVTQAPAAPGRFPVLLHPQGFAAFRDASLYWIEELASHGYVVVGMDQPGTSAATVLSNGRVIQAMDVTAFKRYMPLALSQSSNASPEMNGAALPGGTIPFLAADLSFVLDRVAALDREDSILAGHLDIGRVGVFGMSLGGYTGPEACRLDARLRACLAVDAGKTAEVARDGLTQPVMIIGREADSMREERSKAGGWPEDEIAHTIRDQRALFEHNRADAYYITQTGMYHLNWTDAPIWTPLVRWVGLAGPIDPYRGFSQTNAYTLAFFDRYLKSESAPLLSADAPRPRDLRFEMRLVDAP